MAAGTYSFTIEQGATLSRVITLRDALNVLVNLTGHTARMHLRTQISAPDPAALILTTENGGIALGGAAGTVTLSISATATAALSASSYVYDFETVSGGVVKRWFQGTITMSPEVTR